MDLVWFCVGLAGQSCFAARFLVQWIVSERRRASVIPGVFWRLSFAGGLAILAYAIHRRDPIFIAGQAAGLCVYARNLALISKSKEVQCPPLTT